MFKRIFHKKKKSVLYSEMPKNENMELTVSNLRSIIGKNVDVEFKEIFICGDKKYPATLIFVSGLVDVKSIARDVIKPLMDKSLLCEKDSLKNIISLIEHGFVHLPVMNTHNNINNTVNDILTGSCALVFDNEKMAITFEIKGFEKRSISEPTNESSVKGPKDSFVESIRVNTATIRRKIASQNLSIEQTKVGKQSLTEIEILYLNGTVNRNIVNEVKRRLENIEIDGVIEPGFVEEYIVDKRYTTFPLILSTERPDKFCIGILEGRVGLIIDGLPIAYIIPASIQQFLRASDDYSQNFIVVSALRLLRYISMALTIFLPAFYIAITTFHQEMIPTKLAIAIASAKEGVPYPSFIEIFIMLIAFEILLEAGLRLPKNIGQAVSVVGALVVGEAAVNANLISPTVVVVIAITSIASFTMPSQDFSNALRIWKFIMAILSSILGIFGMSIGAIFLLYHLSSIETFGVAFLSPFVASEGKDIWDSIIRAPLKLLKKRPFILRTPNERRQK